MKDKVAIVGIVGLPAKYGGFETLADNLVRNLSDRFDFTVCCSSKSYPNRTNIYRGAKLKYIGLEANGFQSLLYDIVSLIKVYKSSDVILILGVSGTIVLPIFRFFFKGKIIVNIDGLEWKRDKWNIFAKKFLKFSERVAVNFSDYVIADNESIQEYILTEYGATSVFIPYGADHIISPDSIEKTVSLDYAFTVCRIEPENNIHTILSAFATIKHVNYKVVGNWDKSAYGKQLRSQYACFDNIELLDPIYDQDVLDNIRANCKYYIHGHSAGGTNPSLVEAMYLGLCIFAFDVGYNRFTTNNRAIYFTNSEALIEAIISVKQSDVERVGANMKQIALENYTWKKISNKYSDLLSTNP